jgi:hypothetical protein
MCIRLASEGHQRELAYIINSLLRSDHPEAAPDLAVVVAAMNTLLLSRRGDIKMLRFPPNGVTYRGGGLRDEYKSFFTPGKVFRVAGFLASSFLLEKADEFMCFADARGEPCVMWELRVDPEGERLVSRTCKHVNYVARTKVPGEEEYLFAPYSPFTVKEVRVCMYVCMYV